MFTFLRRWPLLLPALVLLGLFLYMTAPGFAGTGDSASYVWAAHSFQESGRLLAPGGGYYRYWGPLYPVLLAGFYGPLGVRVLHGVALLAHLVLWGQIGRWLLPPGRATVLGWLVALSTAVLVPAGFIWSETVFGALAAAYLFAIVAWGRNKGNGWLGLATAVGFLLPLQRTAGFFLLLAAGAGLVFTEQVRGRWGKLLLHWAGCAVGGLAWSYYAEVLMGPPPPYEHLHEWSVLSLMAPYGFVLARWLVPIGASWVESGTGLWALVVPVALYLLFPRRNPGLSAPTSIAPTDISSAQSLRLLWWTVLLTMPALLLATWTGRAALGPHNAERYCAALVGPIYVLALARWPVLAANTKARAGRWAEMLLLGGWLAYSAVRAGHNAHEQRQRVPMRWPESRALEPAAAPSTSRARESGRGARVVVQPVFPAVEGRFQQAPGSSAHGHQ